MKTKPDIFSAEQPDDEARDAVPEKRLSFFISYKHNEVNNNIASRIEMWLSGKYDVFLDQRIPPSIEWAKAIKQGIANADYVIALISADAIDSDTDGFYEELVTAREQYNKTRKPVIIPVLIEISDFSDYRLGTLINRFQFYHWDDSEDFKSLLEMIESVATGQPAELTDIAVKGLEDYIVNDLTTAHFADSYMAIPEVGRAAEALKKKSLVWITGDSGVRNFAALSIAMSKGVERAHQIPRSYDWARLVDTMVSDEVLILPDVLPSHFEGESAGRELTALSNLVSRGNLLILTSSDDEFVDARRQMRSLNFKDYHHERIGYESYNVEAKRQIFGKLLETSAKLGNITPDQFDLGKSLLEKLELNHPLNQRGSGAKLQVEIRNRFSQVIEKWSPEDIKRFVIHNLPEVERLSDMAKLLQQNATLDDEIHSWFLSLDDSIKCFVLTLAIFSEADSRQLWSKYKQVFNRLHQIDPKLSLWPLGICRHRATPHVSQDGTIEFANDRVAEIIRLEIARNYREYLIEMMPEIKQWSSLELAQESDLGSTEERDKSAIARMVGEALKIDDNDLIGLLEQWADHLSWQIREAFAIAVERTVTDVSGASRTFRLIWEWCFSSSGASSKSNRVLAAATALGRIACVLPGSSVSKQALQYMTLLTEDNRARVTGFLSIAVRKAARKLPLSDIADLLYRLAHTNDPFTKLNAADALNETRSVEEAAASALQKEWVFSNDASLRWLAICSRIIQGRHGNWKKKSGEIIDEIRGYMTFDSVTFADAIRQAINEDHYRKRALATLYELAKKSEYGSNSEIVTILASSLSQQPDEGFLTLLRSSGWPRLASLVVEIKSEAWKRLLSNPIDFLASIDEGLSKQEITAEARKALELLIRPETMGCQGLFVQAMAFCLQHEHERAEAVLLKLKSAASTSFSSVALEARREALAGLLPEPASFVSYLYQDLRHPDRVAETFSVLDLLAVPEPTGRQNQLVEGLLKGYSQKPREVDALVAMFRQSNIQSLHEVILRIKPRLLESLIPNPAELLKELLKARRDLAEWKETLNVMQHLATPGPHGKRSPLISSLAQAMIQSEEQVRSLLQDGFLRTRRYLGFGFRLQIKLEFYIRRLTK